jgi:hypothetical protein
MEIASSMKTTFEARGVVADSWALDVDLVGARVEPPEEVSTMSRVPVL